MPSLALVFLLLLSAPGPLAPGDHDRSIEIEKETRSYLIHVPPKYDAKTPTPVVLALHGALMNGSMMAAFSGLSAKADEAGFVVVYPNGHGAGGVFLFWNAGGPGGKPLKDRPDDLAFLARVLDDVKTVVNVDPRRVYATGMSNGAFMCYLVAAELADRIAAIAPVAGTMAIGDPTPQRPVPVIHFHGTADTFVPFAETKEKDKDDVRRMLGFRTVHDTIHAWAKIDGCPEKPETTELPDKAQDGTSVTREAYGPGKEQSEVVLYKIIGGGHTWPGRQPAFSIIGKSTKNISANDLMWEFFQRHPLPVK